MSALKDEWSSLIKSRGGGPVEAGKTDDVKTRLVDSLKFVLDKRTTQLVIDPPRIEVRPEFEALRHKVHKTLQELQVQAQQIGHFKPQETTKQYMFGLNVQRARSVSPLKPNTEIKKSTPRQIRCIDDIYRLEDAPFKGGEFDPLEDRYEIFSIASKKTAAGKHIEDPQREISFLADISPIARYMTNMRADEEQLFYEGACPLPGIDVSGCVHFLEADCDQYFNDQVDFEDVLQFVMGRLPRQKLYPKVATLQRENPTYLDSWKPLEDLPQRRGSEMAMTSSHLQFKPSNFSLADSIAESKEEDHSTISITVPPAVPEEELEQRLTELLEAVKSLQEGRIKEKDFDKKLQLAISLVGEEVSKQSPEKHSLKMRLLIGFITEYRRHKELKAKGKLAPTKPLVPRTRPLTSAKQSKQPRPTAEVDPEDYLYSRREVPKVTKMKGGWGTGTTPSVLNSRYAPIKPKRPIQVQKEEAKWIGGNKNRDELEGDWTPGKPPL